MRYPVGCDATRINKLAPAFPTAVRRRERERRVIHSIYGGRGIKSPLLSNRTKKPGHPPKTSKSLPQRTQRSQKKI